MMKQTTNVPTWFAGIFGISSIPVTAEATAGGTGGAANDYDIEIVLDTTASMNSNDPNCGMSKIACALAGVEALLQQVSPSADYVGLMAFPGLASTTEQTKDYTCGAGNPTTTAYKNVPTTTTAGNPTYQVLGLSHDYKASNTATSLSSTSNLVIATGGGGCQGMQAPGGYGTFYADAITAAQNDLAANGRPGAKAIVFLSDGDANASTSNMTAAEHSQQCPRGRSPPRPRRRRAGGPALMLIVAPIFATNPSRRWRDIAAASIPGDGPANSMRLCRQQIVERAPLHILRL